MKSWPTNNVKFRPLDATPRALVTALAPVQAVVLASASRPVAVALAAAAVVAAVPLAESAVLRNRTNVLHRLIA